MRSLRKEVHDRRLTVRGNYDFCSEEVSCVLQNVERPAYSYTLYSIVFKREVSS